MFNPIKLSSIPKTRLAIYTVAGVAMFPLLPVFALMHMLAAVDQQETREELRQPFSISS